MREAIRDKERLSHIDYAIKELLTLSANHIETIKDGSLEYFGVVKLIEIIGEAVYKLTSDFKDSHPETPWRQIERMRHVLVHGYYSVHPNFVKEVIISDLPTLQNQIEKYIAELD